MIEVFNDGVIVVKKGTDAYGFEKFSVKVGANRARVFTGETAWSDHERYAQDNQGWPFTYIFGG